VFGETWWDSHRVGCFACTSKADTARMPQQARNLLMQIDDGDRQVRFLIHHCDAKFPCAFDALLAGDDIKVIRTPFPGANANLVDAGAELPSRSWIRNRARSSRRVKLGLRAIRRLSDARVASSDVQSRSRPANVEPRGERAQLSDLAGVGIQGRGTRGAEHAQRVSLLPA
jgi:hypothetical protein